MTEPTSSARRRFLSRLALGVAALPLLRVNRAAAADLPHLSPDDPAAKALHFALDAAKLDPKKEPLYQAGRHCGTCALYQAAQASGDWAPCGAFPGKAVPKAGWCQAWAPMA